MTDLIGATAFVPPSLNQQLLIFDRIAWPTACSLAPFASSEEEVAQVEAERQFLLGRRIVFAPNVRGPFIGGVPRGLGLDPQRSWRFRANGELEPMSEYLERGCDQAARAVASYLRGVEHSTQFR